MTKIKEKLVLALADADTAKELEKFGLTKDVIEGYEELEKPATFDEALKVFQYQSDYDKKIAQAIKTREDNLRAKYDFKEKEQPTEPTPKTDNPELAALLQKFADLEKKMEKQEEEKQQLTLQQKKDKAKQLLQSKSIPGVYESMFDLDKDLEEQIETVVEKYTEDFGQAPKQTSRLPFPKRTETKNEPSKEEIEAFKRKM